MSPSCPLGISLFVFADLHRSEYLVSVGDGVDGDIQTKENINGSRGFIVQILSRVSRVSKVILDSR